ncbi:mannitol dehydrogenase family protein [Microbulbifer thermotolerans]|uniref:Mannitol dehydrogenase family protein n=1 Tax=Microbulbifer thermotolerans TaxID=252514 RepID=A0AB35I1X0_MICTH|nr:mannitol dehydrogenase family protein [Microbulbifer thermotolerans]MCX2803077.1 mannitol dehydrogenase family protein [Microbulbifer thermotolerans]
MPSLNVMALNDNNLKFLPNNVIVPKYDRKLVKTGIVHVGVGGFHRSHQAFYTDEYMGHTGDLRWGICGVGLREADRKMKDILENQDYLYTLMVKHSDGRIENRVIGSLTNFLLGCDNPQVVIDKMAADETKIVSLTITEAGYNYNPATGEFNFDNPDVKHDLAHPEAPRLVFGYLVAALKQRKEAGKVPFTIQSCDNIQHNGDVTRKILVAYARELDADLALWIEREVSFPNAMVDRITPVTTPSDIEYLRSEIGLEDKWPVTCEKFLQWVIEDRFSQGRPDWDKVGAQFVPDVTPYETMKIRLLNAGHTVLGMLGSLHGYKTIDECVRDPVFAEFLTKFMDEEVTPVLPPLEGIDLSAYKSTLLERFGNPNIKDALSRICLDSSSKVATFLVPTVVENLKRKGEFRLSALTIAAWCYYSAMHADQAGNALEVNDAMADELHELARQPSEGIPAFLTVSSIFGDLPKHEGFVADYNSFVDGLFANVEVKSLMQSVLQVVQ